MKLITIPPIAVYSTRSISLISSGSRNFCIISVNIKNATDIRKDALKKAPKISERLYPNVNTVLFCLRPNLIEVKPIIRLSESDNIWKESPTNVSELPMMPTMSSHSMYAKFRHIIETIRGTRSSLTFYDFATYN